MIVPTLHNRVPSLNASIVRERSTYDSLVVLDSDFDGLGSDYYAAPGFMMTAGGGCGYRVSPRGRGAD